MLKILKNFTDSPTSGGIILFICVLISLTIANSPLGATFENILNTPLGFETASVHLRYTTALWINDGLMAIFFLLVGLEIKRELVSGELSTPRQALLPIFCAFGGAIVPAGIYFAVNQGTETVSGWGIPMATDIAFALAVIAMLGKRVPASLKVFLAALAIVDDLIAILVIAIFYSAELHTIYLGYAAAILALLFIFNRLGVRSLIFYLIPGLFIWYFVHHSGIHATIAGVLTAMTIPLATKGQKEPPLLKLEHALTTPVNFLIVPLFALANTAIRFEEGMLEGLISPLGIGIIVGLMLGKPVGVYLMTKLAILLRIGSMPQGASWAQIIGVGLLAGIGFTMSIFIALLSFSDNLLIAEAKFSILVASLLSGVTGYILLNRVATPSNDNEKKT
ncbi:Na+/H+ antiporter NhaA [Sphingobacterium corticibacterium]|uniref:Na(+)/H(+) antiporter NhaA n=1 Tax=Sphingobacterium corticibacterium TaxID=2484746 RepID=A0A4Q6Y105_9SPHI|nr:Na+/H+ antiporter NhaA [Sphingobacterium corticibacterium]RZF62666.1 Na+/H+ antiporter NhaA [Sphingobacterium corticibacterium]